MKNKIRKLLKDFPEIGIAKFTLIICHVIVNDLASFIARRVSFDSKRDPTKRVFDSFVTRTNAMPGPRILELGSRNISHRKLFNSYSEYVGFDINAGPNVDVVGDIHRLSNHFPQDSFDVVYCISVFEHLAMPWKAITEINKVMKKDGIFFIFTHPTYPPHALPWDFWRFSKAAFSVLLNSHTGFKIKDCEDGIPCSIISLASDTGGASSQRTMSFMGIAVLAEKSNDLATDFNWNIETKDIIQETYPQEYLNKSYSPLLEYCKRRDAAK